MTVRPHFEDLNRRYAETDLVSEYQRLWAIFNHWFVVHIGNPQDRHCIEALKSLPETSRWVSRIIEDSKIKRPQRVTDGLDGSHPRFTANNVISLLFRDTINSPVIEPMINYPWRPGSEPRVKKTNAIALDEDMFIPFASVGLGLDFARYTCHIIGHHHLAAGPCPAHNKSLHWIFISLRSIKTSEFNRYVAITLENPAIMMYFRCKSKD